jgi:uncharacterized RDD family membrane protein YckC
VQERPLLKTVPPSPRKAEEELPLFDKETPAESAIASRPSPERITPVPPVPSPEPDNIQDLIDRTISQSATEQVSEPVGTASLPDLEGEDKLILLSRILSGLIDLLIVGICTGAFVVAADVLSGINLVDGVSILYYGALLMATHVVYSAFFLGTANQTIGMMMKDLRVVGINGDRPKIGQILGRCAAFLLSWLTLGIGLCWAALNRDAMCLHDKLSRTRVVRL